MQANHIALGIGNQRDVAILSDGEFFLFHFAAEACRLGRLYRAIFANEIHKDAISTRWKARHLDERYNQTSDDADKALF